MLFRAMAESRSLENPNLSLDDPEAWDEAFGDDFGSTASGVRVNHRTAMRISGVWRGVHLIANTVGKIPLEIKRTDTDEADRTHPAYRLLRREAMSFTDKSSALSAFEFKRTLTNHAIIRGNGYAYIEHNGSHEPQQLRLLLPDRTYPVRVNGKLWYVTSIGGPFEDESSTLVKIRPEHILHIHGLGYDGLSGYPLLEYARDEFGLEIAQSKYSAVFFKNAATPKVVIEAPSVMSDKAYARLAKSWQNMKAGLENAHKTAILEEGAKANPLSISARDAQLVESRKFNLVAIANFLNLPVHKVGGEGRTAFASLQEENQSVADDAYDPWFHTWESECYCKLLTEEQKRNDSHEAEFDRKALIKQDMAKRGAFLRTVVGGPIMERDEARKDLGLPPLAKKKGLLIPLNMTVEGEQPEDDDDDDDTSTGDDDGRSAEPLTEPVRQLIRDTVQRMSKRLVTSAERGREPWDDQSHRSILQEALTPVATLARCDAGELRDTVIAATKLRVTRDEQDVPESVSNDVIGVYFDEDKEVT